MGCALRFETNPVIQRPQINQRHARRTPAGRLDVCEFESCYRDRIMAAGGICPMNEGKMVDVARAMHPLFIDGKTLVLMSDRHGENSGHLPWAVATRIWFDILCMIEFKTGGADIAFMEYMLRKGNGVDTTEFNTERARLDFLPNPGAAVQHLEDFIRFLRIIPTGSAKIEQLPENGFENWDFSKVREEIRRFISKLKSTNKLRFQTHLAGTSGVATRNIGESTIAYEDAEVPVMIRRVFHFDADPVRTMMMAKERGVPVSEIISVIREDGIDFLVLLGGSENLYSYTTQCHLATLVPHYEMLGRMLRAASNAGVDIDGVSTKDVSVAISGLDERVRLLFSCYENIVITSKPSSHSRFDLSRFDVLFNELRGLSYGVTLMNALTRGYEKGG